MHMVVDDSSFTCRFYNLIKKWYTFPNPPFPTNCHKEIAFYNPITGKTHWEKVLSDILSNWNILHCESKTAFKHGFMLTSTHMMLFASQCPWNKHYSFFMILYSLSFIGLHVKHTNRTMSVNHLLWLICFVLRIAFKEHNTASWHTISLSSIQLIKYIILSNNWLYVPQEFTSVLLINM